MKRVLELDFFWNVSESFSIKTKNLAQCPGAQLASQVLQLGRSVITHKQKWESYALLRIGAEGHILDSLESLRSQFSVSGLVCVCARVAASHGCINC